MTAIVPVPRTCTLISKNDKNRNSENVSQPLESFRSVPAYVLLGDPGAGKTTAFDTEYRNVEDGYYITARDFLTFGVSSRPEWQGRTLFIDGLDEVRAGKGDARVPFDAIRSRLVELGTLRFRLSCREADWLGDNDRKKLEDISPDNSVVMLRLDPLTESDATHILQSHPRVEDASAFIEKARQVGIEGLLENPQNLNMLAAAVTGANDWPQSRLEVFELASREMAREHNDEHSIADQAKAEGILANPDKLLDAAGRLCALMLISGAAGFARDRDQENANYPAWERCAYEHPEYLKSALSTKLFKAESTDRVVPVHRHVAEFLAGRHLGRIIDGGPDQVNLNGLPARRVIALLTGEDGMVVSELRGLSAWLATHCKKSRRDLISRDPTGVGLYGDIRGFSLDEKRELLMALKHHMSGLEKFYHSARSFAPLATPDMESDLRKILEESNLQKAHQLFVDFVLCVLSHGEPMPGLSNVLFEIVRNREMFPWVNRSAFIAFLHNCPESDEKARKVKCLLKDIEKEIIADSENEMLGKILSQLYPKLLTPAEIWDYLQTSRRHVFGGTYEQFWQHELLERSSDDQVVELLDNLVDRLPDLYTAIENRHAGDLIVALLSRGLATHGDITTAGRLYDWLGVGCPDLDYQLTFFEYTEINIRTWIEQRPNVYKAIILEGLNRGDDSEDFWSHAFDVERRLYHATRPADYGLWSLNQAVALADTKPRIAEYFWEQAINAHRYQRNNEGLSPELLEQYARKNNDFAARLERLLNQKYVRMERSETHKVADKLGSTVDWQSEERQKALSERHRNAIEQRQQKDKQWLDHIRANEAALHENRAEPALLSRLAKIYFGPFFNFKDGDRPKAIKESLHGDPVLVDAVLVGLRGTIDREDVPNVADILHHYEANKRYYIGLPCLAGQAERERTAPEDITQWSDERVRKTLAFYFTEAHGDYQPDWLKQLLAARPQTVADVYIGFARPKLKRGTNSIQDIHRLSSNPDYSKVARIASLPLLKAFPTRSRSTQNETLEHLLTAAIRHADSSSLQNLVDAKLSRTSMDVAQRARWLAAGLIVSPGKYNDCVDNFIGTGRGRVSRVYHLMALLHPDAFDPLRFPGQGIPELELLVRLFGRDVTPDAVFGTEEFDVDGESMGGSVTHAMSASFFVRDMIERLAADPNREATDALEALRADDTLSDWHDMLASRLHTQRRIRRDASYHRLTIEQICQTLKGGTPANAGDLAALVMDRLSELATTIRDGNTDDWRQYWNLPHGQLPTPRNENHCRDALLSDLRRCLPTEIDAQPEVQYANDKRADMRIAFQNFQVPVEIKKNCHRNLWSAMHKQLIQQYVRDPATDGYGIYLVFWFGEKYTQAPPEGKLPGSPEELQERLAAALSQDEARKVTVCVIDVSSS